MVWPPFANHRTFAARHGPRANLPGGTRADFSSLRKDKKSLRKFTEACESVRDPCPLKPETFNPLQGYSTLFNPARAQTLSCHHLSPITRHSRKATAIRLCALVANPLDLKAPKVSESLRKDKKVSENHSPGGSISDCAPFREPSLSRAAETLLKDNNLRFGEKSAAEEELTGIAESMDREKTSVAETGT